MRKIIFSSTILMLMLGWAASVAAQQPAQVIPFPAPPAAPAAPAVPFATPEIVGRIGIWGAPGVLTDQGNAIAPGNFSVTGNLNVTGTIVGNATTGNSIPGLGGGPAFTGQFTGSTAPTNNALKALCASACISGQTVVYRAGFDAAGDGGAGWYRWMSGTCASLDPSGGNAAADDGVRVAGASGCFVLAQPMSNIPIEIWGVQSTTPAATNAARIVAAINESDRDGFTILLSRFYPTTQIVVTVCANIMGTGLRSSGLVYDAPVATAGLSITCPVRYGNVNTSFWIRLSNFAMITKVVGGGTAIILTFNRDAAGVGPSTPTVAVDYMMITGDNNCGTKVETAPLVFECTGTPIPAHWWTNGIVGTDLGLAKFENNFIYGEAEPMKPGAPKEYNMQDGISIGGKFCHAPQFVGNNIFGTHYAIRQRVSNGGGCEGEWISNNNLLRNDYGIYLEGDSSYPIPQFQILNNSLEAQREGIHAGNPQSVGELQIHGNIIYMGGGFVNNNYLNSTCIKLYRAEKMWITNNECVNLTANATGGGAYGGIGLDIDGSGQNGRSQYGTLSGNYFEAFEGGIHLGNWTRIIYVDANWVAGEVTAPRYFLKNEALGNGPGFAPSPYFNFVTIRCGYGTTAANRQASYNAGLRADAADCVNPWP